LHAETVATYDRYAARFADRFWSNRLVRPMLRFASSLPAGGVVVDLGCGPGRDTAWLAEQGFTAIGLDASGGMLAEARRRVDDASTFVQGDLVSLPFAPGSVDGAWVCASLLHLDPGAAIEALHEVRRVLRPGAPLFAGVQQGEGDTIKRNDEGERFFTLWSPVEFAGAVSAAGFEVEHVGSEPAADGVRWVQVHGRKLGGF
jgi:ubiquinone/menaquinone biosynthesis C-methylase UbiE